jgi:20S proteasome subunit beta 6
MVKSMFKYNLSNTLYGKRFFPYYTFNLLVGLDENNDGVIYGYDAVGSFDKLKYGVMGSG